MRSEILASRIVQHVVGLPERVDEARVVLGDVEQALVRYDDQGVDVLSKKVDALRRRFEPPPSFTVKRPRDDGDRQDAEFSCDGSHYWSAASARTTTHSRSDEEHVEVLNRLFDLVAILLDGFRTDARPRSGAEPLGEVASCLNLVRCHVGGECLAIRIDGDELDALNTARHHVVDGVATAAADTENANPGFLIHVVVEGEPGAERSFHLVPPEGLWF
jgi:hypothetical protein